MAAGAAVAAVLVLAGCGTANVTANSSNASFSLSPTTVTIDTNCTGCNATDAHGRAVHQFAAITPNGSRATVTWSLSGGDAGAGAGTINAAGEYTPPSYLTADEA